MPINPNDLAVDLKAAFSVSTDPTIKTAVDNYYDQLAVIITNHIKRGSVTSVTVTGGAAQNNVAMVV